MERLNRTATALQYSVDTTEEYMAMAVPPVADDLRERFAVVQRPVDPSEKSEVEAGHNAITELVTVAPAADGGRESLLHLQHNHQSETGWKAVEVALPSRRLDGAPLEGRIEQIAAFYQNGEIHALLHYAQASGEGRTVLPMKYSAIENRWHEWDLRDDVDEEGYDIFRGDLRNALSSTRQTGVYRTRGGNHIFYGISTAQDDEEFFLVFETENGNWEAAKDRVPEAGSSYRLVAMDIEGDVGRYTVLRFDSDGGVHARDLEIDFGDVGDDGYYLEWQDNERSGSVSADSGLGAASVTPLPSTLGTNAVLVKSESGELALVSNYLGDGHPTQTQLTGRGNRPSAVGGVSVGLDGQGHLVVFASALNDDQLWILRQDPDAEGKLLQFLDWSCLGNSVSAFACPRAMLDGPEVFLVRPNDRAVEHLVQSPETSIWHAADLAVAHPEEADPTQISAHAVEVLALDAHGVPAAGAALEIYASHACTIAIDGIGHKANSRHPIRVVTDVTGRMNVKMKADSLSSPHLRVRIAANGNETDIQADSRIAERLQNKDPRIMVDAGNLKKAGLIPENASNEDARILSQMTRSIGEQLADRQADRRPENHDKAVEYQIDVSNRQNPALTRTNNARWGGPDTDARQAASGSTVFSLIGDALNRLKHAWEDVTKLVIKVAKGVARFAIMVAGKVEEFIVDTAHGIARAFEAFFSFVANAYAKAADIVGKILKFVTAAFDWAHISETNDLISHAFLDFLGKSEAFIRDSVAPQINRTMTEMKHGLQETLEKLEDVVGGLTFGPDGIGGHADPGGHQSKAGRTIGANGVHCRLVETHARNHRQRALEQLDDVDFPADDNVQQVLEDLGRHLAKSGESNLIQPTLDLIDDLKAYQTPSEMLGGGLVALIRNIKGILSFTLDVAKEMLTVIARLAAIFIKWLKSALERPLSIPVVSFLFKQVTGAELRLIDFFTFGIAVPAAVIATLSSRCETLSADHVTKAKASMEASTSMAVDFPTVAEAKSKRKPEPPKPAPDKSARKAQRIAAGVLAIAKGIMEFLFKPNLLLLQQSYDSVPDEVEIPQTLQRVIFLLLLGFKVVFNLLVLAFSIARAVLLYLESKDQPADTENADGIEAWIERIYSIALIVSGVFGALISMIAAVVNYFPKISVYIVYAVKWVVQSFRGTWTTPVFPFNADVTYPTTLDQWKANTLADLGATSKIAAGITAVLHFILDAVLLLVCVVFGIWIFVENVQHPADPRGWLLDISLVFGSLYGLLSFVPPLIKFLGSEAAEASEGIGALVLAGLYTALMTLDQVCPMVSGGCNIAIGAIELDRVRKEAA